MVTDAKMWRDKYCKLRRVFDKAEEQFADQTQDYLAKKKKIQIQSRKFKRLKNKCEGLRALCNDKCEENERLYCKLQRVERRIVGVPKGQYLLKRNLRLKKKLQNLRKEMKFQSGEDSESTEIQLHPDEILFLVKEKSRLEEEAQKTNRELTRCLEGNTALTLRVKEFWEVNQELMQAKASNELQLSQLQQKHDRSEIENKRFNLLLEEYEETIKNFQSKQNEDSVFGAEIFHSQLLDLTEENAKSKRLSLRCHDLTNRLKNALDTIEEQRRTNEKLRKQTQTLPNERVTENTNEITIENETYQIKETDDFER